MRMCQPHWDQLRKAISDKNLMHLVAKSGEEAIARMITELEDKPDQPSARDPLMEANLSIMSQALDQGGLYLMSPKEDGTDYCPLCEVVVHTEIGMDSKWIEGCTDAILQDYKDNALL